MTQPAKRHPNNKVAASSNELASTINAEQEAKRIVEHVLLLTQATVKAKISLGTLKTPEEITEAFIQAFQLYLSSELVLWITNIIEKATNK